MPKCSRAGAWLVRVGHFIPRPWLEARAWKAAKRNQPKPDVDPDDVSCPHAALFRACTDYKHDRRQAMADAFLAGASVHGTTAQGESLLQFAIRTQQTNYGLDPNPADPGDHILRRLVKLGAPVTVSDPRLPALYSLARNGGHPEVVEMLISWLSGLICGMHYLTGQEFHT